VVLAACGDPPPAAVGRSRESSMALLWAFVERDRRQRLEAYLGAALEWARVWERDEL